MGVKHAVDMAFEHVRKARGPVYTFGPLIHNPQVLELLKARGVNLLETVPEKGQGSVIIRAHGISPQHALALQRAGFEIIDATCPKVIKVQKIIEKYHQAGYDVILLGEKEHPEIIGLNGYADNKAHIVLNLNELKALPTFAQAVVVAQTTLNFNLFEAAHQWLKTAHPHYKTINTICNSTEKRQKELRALAGNVDGFIIVGGLASGNTRRLKEVAQETGRPALHIESAKDLTPQNLKPFAKANRIALTAGASTPNWTIQAVNHTLQNTGLKRGSLAYFTAKLLPLANLIHAPLALTALMFICQHFYAYSPNMPLPLLAFFYGWSMHATSKISGTKAAGFHAPLLAGFYDRCKTLIAASCLVAGAIAILIGFYISVATGIIIAAACVMRFVYDVLPLARKVSGSYNYFIDMPYSKACCLALAWGVVAGVLPGLGHAGVLLMGLMFVWAAGLAFARVMCQDMFAMQTDRICGQTTLILLLGYQKGVRFLCLLLFVLAVYPAPLYYLGFTGPLTLAAMLCPALMLTVVTLYIINRHKIVLPFKLEILVSLSFIITGLVMLMARLF